MDWLKRHLRNTFLTGIFSAIPLVITVVVIWYVEKLTREPLKALFGLDTPFLGVAVAIGVLYALGLLINSILGRYLLRWLDALLRKVPVLKDIYEAWKQITLTPGGKEGIYAQVVLIPGANEASFELAFTSGEPVEGNPELCFVVRIDLVADHVDDHRIGDQFATVHQLLCGEAQFRLGLDLRSQQVACAEVDQPVTFDEESALRAFASPRRTEKDKVELAHWGSEMMR